MSDIQRYSISGCGEMNCEPLMIDDAGEYVEYADVKPLLAEIERLSDAAKIDSGLIEALKSRLEINPGHNIDGIDARNATIKGLDEQCDQIKAENERLRKLPTCWSEVIEQSETNDQLLDQVLELSKDAERYRFIVDCPIRTMVALSRKATEADFDLSAECDQLMSKIAARGK